MDGKDWLASLEPGQGGHEASWLDVLVYAEQEHGAGATRWLADEMGVSLRSAQRYMKLDHAPQRAGPARAARRLMTEVGEEMAAEDEDQRRADAADLLGLMRTVTPGKVWVVNRSGLPGRPKPRTIKELRGVDMAEVAAAWLDRDDEEAEDELSIAILDAYGEQTGTAELGSHIRIVDYETGIDYT